MKQVCLIALLLVLTIFARGAGASNRPPNVIIILTDDQGWGDTGYNGHPELKTPNLDALAASGLRFNRFYAAHFNCSPTRGSGCITLASEYFGSLRNFRSMRG